MEKWPHASVIACIFILAALIAVPTLGQTTSLPAPVSPTMVTDNSSVNITWLPPTTSSGQVNAGGCASVLVAMTAVAKNFSVEYPSIALNLSDGGNDVGFAEWLSGQLDVADASRKINQAEEQKAASIGYNVTETKVAVESIAFIVRNGTNLPALEPAQLKGIFAGSITNWNQVGGPDLPVVLYSPPSGGSPYLFFNNIFMTGTPFASSVTHVNNTTSLIEMVANTSGAIGFVRSGFVVNASDVQAIDIKANASSPSYSPLDFKAALNSSYAFSRNYYLYTNGPPKNATGMWIYYVLAKERGQRIMADAGFIPLNDTDLNRSRANIATFSDDPVLGYKVHRTGGTEADQVFETNGTFYNDTSVQAGNRYTYFVSAVFKSGEGERTTSFNVTIPKSGDGNSTGTTTNGIDVTGILALGAVGAIGLGAVVFVISRGRKR